MTKADKVKCQARLIAESNGGQNLFNMTESAKIVGCHVNSITRFLNDSGVFVKRHGRQKKVSALDLAEAMYYRQESPMG